MKTREQVIIMGDIVGSSSYDDITGLSKIFQKAVSSANRKFKKEILSPLTITLGDEFQAIASNLVHAYRIIKFVNYNLKLQSVITRFVIGVGKLDTNINRERAWQMMGPGLKTVRSFLNEKYVGKNFRFLVNDKISEILLNALGSSLSEIESSWTDHQQTIICKIGLGKSFDNICEEYSFTKVNLYKLLKSARFKLYNEISNSIEEALVLLDGERNRA